MPSLAPDLRGALERVQDKIGNFLERWKPHRSKPRELEGLSADLIPSFIQHGGPVLTTRQTPEEVVVTAEVPGLERDDFSVELEGRRLTIRGEKSVTEEKKSAGSYFSRGDYRSFASTVVLPCEVDPEKVKAKLKNGILSVRMGKPEAKRSPGHRVSVS